MIVREVMTVKLITVEPGDTLSHAATLMRQYEFHHLPVVQKVTPPGSDSKVLGTQKQLLLLEGIVTSEDIDLAVAVSRQNVSGDGLHRPWQEQRVAEVMHGAAICVTPTTTVAAAAHILVERGINYLPVVEYGQSDQQTQFVLVGLLTRSDLLMALARAMGAYEPGMQIDIVLSTSDVSPLARTLLLATELRIQIRSVIVAPLDKSFSRVATVRLGTINPTPLLVRMQKEHIQYTFVDPLVEGDTHG